MEEYFICFLPDESIQMLHFYFVTFCSFNASFLLCSTSG